MSKDETSDMNLTDNKTSARSLTQFRVIEGDGRNEDMINERVEELVRKALWLANWGEPEEMFDVAEFISGMAEITYARDAGWKKAKRECENRNDPPAREMQERHRHYTCKIYKEKFGVDIEEARRAIERKFIKRLISESRLVAWEETRELPCLAIPAWLDGEGDLV